MALSARPGQDPRGPVMYSSLTLDLSRWHVVLKGCSRGALGVL